MQKTHSRHWALAACAAAAVMAIAMLAGCSSGSNDSGAKSDDKGAASGQYTLIKEGVLTVGTSPDFPPFENMEGDKYVGFDMELGAAVAEKLGLEFAPTTLQFDAIIPAVQTGGQCDVGISGFSVDPERAQQIDFTKSYYIDDQAVVAMKDSDITSSNIDETVNKAETVIAVQSGSTGEAYAKENFPNATVKPYGNAADCFAALQAGEANVVCTNNAVAKNTIEGSYQDAQIVKADATGEEYAMVVSKDNPALTEAINGALAELESDGTIEALTQKYFG